MGGCVPPTEENADLSYFTPERAHMMLRGVYGYYLHHNDGLHLDGGVADDAILQRHWRRIYTQSAIWYAMPSGAVGHRLTAILAAEWWGFLGRSLNSERPLVFAHVVLTKALGVRRAKEIRARITRRMDLWERGIHVGLLGDAKAGKYSREDRAANGGEEEDDTIARSYHDNILSGKLRQAVLQATDWEGGGCLLSDDQCTNTRRPVAEVLWENHPDTRVPPVENPTCAAIKEYEEVPETAPIEFTEGDITWVASNMSGAAGTLGAEAIELRNWLLCFGCTL